MRATTVTDSAGLSAPNEEARPPTANSTTPRTSTGPRKTGAGRRRAISVTIVMPRAAMKNRSEKLSPPGPRRMMKPSSTRPT